MAAAPTTVSLIAGGYTFTFADGTIDSITETIISNASPLEIPTSGPMGSLGMDNESVGKQIVITGRLQDAVATVIAGQSILTKYDQKRWLESVLNGNQVPMVFSSPLGDQTIDAVAGASAPNLAHFTTTKVIISRVEFKYDAGFPNFYTYQITLFVGS